MHCKYIVCDHLIDVGQQQMFVLFSFLLEASVVFQADEFHLWSFMLCTTSSCNSSFYARTKLSCISFLERKYRDISGYL